MVVLRMIGISQNLQQFVVARRATAVLRWAGAVAVEAGCSTGNGRYFFDDQVVCPSVTEVVLLPETIPDGTEDFVHSNAVLERPGAVVPLFERGLHLVASTGSIGIVADEEHVQVSVFPAHDILDDVV